MLIGNCLIFSANKSLYKHNWNLRNEMVDGNCEMIEYYIFNSTHISSHHQPSLISLTLFKNKIMEEFSKNLLLQISSNNWRASIILFWHDEMVDRETDIRWDGKLWDEKGGFVGCVSSSFTIYHLSHDLSHQPSTYLFLSLHIMSDHILFTN